MKIKISLHNHIDEDPIDNIQYSGFDLINKAQEQGFSCLAFTCHDKFINLQKYQAYAKKKGILLISGIEKTIQKKHVLILNANHKAEKIQTFNQLKIYKKQYPNCFIIAPHPYFFLSNCLKTDLEKHINLFDAIEFNYFYHQYFNPNKQAIKIAKKFKKPLIGTSDTHFLEYFNTTYTTLEVSKITTSEILNSLKKNKLEIITKSFSILELNKLLLKMLFFNRFKNKNVLQTKKSISQ